MEKLTSKQDLILKEIKKYMAKRGYPPTVRELCNNSIPSRQFTRKRIHQKRQRKK